MSEEKVLSKIGMPAALWLDEFGSQVWHAFGEVPYHVGSSLKLGKSDDKPFRDVDVRVILDDEKWTAEGYGALNMSDCHHNGKWVAMCLAFSELGRKMTGLPIDFQIQPRTFANRDEEKGIRSGLGFIALRFKDGGEKR